MTDTEAVRALFNELAPGYDQYLNFFATFGSELVGHCELKSGQHVLDIGAGRGAVTIPAARAVGDGGRVVAIDNAEAMVAALTRDCARLPQVDVRMMDAHDLQFENSSFDVVTCGFVLHFLDDPVQAIREAHRVLRPGGRLAYCGPPTEAAESEKHDAAWDFYPELMREMAGRSGDSGRPELFTPPPRPLSTLCTEAGFATVDHHRASTKFTFRDPEHYWSWSMSHGFRGFVDSLGTELAAEFRDRLFAGLRTLHDAGGITVEPNVVFTVAVKQ